MRTPRALVIHSADFIIGLDVCVCMCERSNESVQQRATSALMCVLARNSSAPVSYVVSRFSLLFGWPHAPVHETHSAMHPICALFATNQPASARSYL